RELCALDQPAPHVSAQVVRAEDVRAFSHERLPEEAEQAVSSPEAFRVVRQEDTRPTANGGAQGQDAEQSGECPQGISLRELPNPGPKGANGIGTALGAERASCGLSCHRLFLSELVLNPRVEE